MRIVVRHAPPFRRWHRSLGAGLERAGHDVRYEAAGPRVGRALIAVERRLYRFRPDADAPEPAPPRPARDGAADLTVDVAGGRSRPTGPLVTFDTGGRAGEAGLHAAARSGTAPLVRVRAVEAGLTRLLAVGRPAIEDPWVAARALETLLPRVVTLLLQGVAALVGGDGEPAPVFEAEAESRCAPPSAPVFLVAGLWAKLRSRLGPARGRPAHWRIGLRRAGQKAGQLLPNVPGRFRADPFLFAEAGRLWLFAEDYPYATGKGVITGSAVASLDPCHDTPLCGGDGSASPTVLEAATHLSYPLVLRHGEAIVMLPESAAASCVRLYRADPFPHRWVPAATLLRGRFADATPILHDGRWWLFATGFDEGGSSWDQLHLFHAPDLFGSWTPHARNPVLIDAAGARPAGHMWHENGVLMRPVQDCRRGYGEGVTVFRVDRLDAGGFRQEPVRRIDLPDVAGATGLHTINRAAGWEAFDLKVPHPAGASG